MVSFLWCHYYYFFYWSIVDLPREGHGGPLQYSGLEHPHGQRSLVGYSPGSEGEDTAVWLSTAQHSIVDLQCCVSFIVVFIYIFLMTNDVGNLLMCSLTIYISSLEKYLFKSFAHFLSWVVSFLFSYKLKSILNTRLLSDIDLQIFSPATVFCTLSRLFHIVGNALWCTQVFKFDEINLSIVLGHCCFCFWCHIWESIAVSKVIRTTVFSSKNFVVLAYI